MRWLEFVGRDSLFRYFILVIVEVFTQPSDVVLDGYVLGATFTECGSSIL